MKYLLLILILLSVGERAQKYILMSIIQYTIPHSLISQNLRVCTKINNVLYVTLVEYLRVKMSKCHLAFKIEG